MFRRAFLTMSNSDTLQTIATDVPPVRRMTRRFVAGETLDEALAVTRQLNADGLSVALDYLGESISHREDAVAYTDEHIRALERLAKGNLDGDIAIKLTAMGLDLEQEFCYENVRRIAECARANGRRLEIDMESSDYVDATLSIYMRLLDHGFDDVLVAIQSYLFRSEQDVADLIERAGMVRLVKGAYDEPPKVAFPDKADVDANFVHLTKMMLSRQARDRGFFAAIATHDEDMIRTTIEYAEEQGIGRDEFEFQMLYGVRSKRQRELRDAGYQIRTYLPYGSHWYPYFMRRLAERPANVIFVLRNLL